MYKTSKICVLIFCALALNTSAKEYPEKRSKKKVKTEQEGKTPVGCAQTTSQAELSINNVRTTILGGGDTWWDLNNPKYEIPKGSGKHSIFAGALWIGGMDAGGQIKVAAQTYRQTGLDYWSGPINTSTVEIEPQQCIAYDRHWVVRREEVREFKEKFADANYVVPDDIRTWPGNGNPLFNEAQFLAPFEDLNGDGIYDWTTGEYPKYDYSTDRTSGCEQYLYGDETVWWVFNDVGNTHTETSSPLSLGLEIRGQAFAFKANDEINNTTFYKYEIINRSFETLNNTWIGQWVDIDLGNAQDDYVGCDVVRGIGYGYNGDDDDETAWGYGINPPAMGFDFVQGPIADPGDSIDNNRNGIVDELGEDIQMTKFMYYNSVNSSPTGNPSTYDNFYTYLQGLWMDGQQLTYGGDGRDPNGDPCSYMFPGDTDPDFSNPWTEATAGNAPADRRFLSSVGPFTFESGAVEYITIAAVWARGNAGTALASIDAMQRADDKAQGLFDNCFKIIEGPAAPDLRILETDQKLTIELLNTDSIELYDVVDPTISTEFYNDNKFRFEGYQIYQLKDATAEIKRDGPQDPDEVRLVAQCDIQNGVGRLINYQFDVITCATIPYPAVEGSDEGISYSFEVLFDQFALGDPELVNHKTYYYSVVSYAHNNYKDFNPLDPFKLDGQKRPYLQGPDNVRTYAAIPHKTLSFSKSDDLGEIHVVPNPYFAFSLYEHNEFENRVKIINLPPTCTIRIFTTDGVFVKQINRQAGSNNDYVALDEYETSVDWDLKNQKGIPIGSGLYLIHIDAPGLGEKVLKWFGVLRESAVLTY